MSRPPASVAICCHLPALPVRYAVGRYFNVPAAAILAFNAADLGSSVLARAALNYLPYAIPKPPEYFLVILIVFIRVLTCAVGFYAAQCLNHPIPRNVATLSHAASGCAVLASMTLGCLIKHKFFPEQI